MEIILKMIENEKKFAMIKHFREYWYKELEKSKDGEYLLLEGLKDCDKKESISKYLDKKMEWKKKKFRYMMFTINPIEGCGLAWFLSKIKKAVKKKWIKNYIWCIEWRKEDIGMHAHIRVEVLYGKRAKECTKEMYNTFKENLGSVMNCHSKGSDRKDAFIDYVKGIDKKKKDCKKDNWAHDLMNRTELNLKNFYIG